MPVAKSKNETALNATVRLLPLWGYTAITAANAEDALDALEKAAVAPVMATLDYRLPGAWNGVELYSKICRRHSSVLPSIPVTGDSSIKRLQEVQACGLPLLHKPINTDKLHRLMIEIEASQREHHRESLQI